LVCNPKTPRGKLYPFYDSNHAEVLKKLQPLNAGDPHGRIRDGLTKVIYFKQTSSSPTTAT
jgi:hypothetical protein